MCLAKLHHGLHGLPQYHRAPAAPGQRSPAAPDRSRGGGGGAGGGGAGGGPLRGCGGAPRPQSLRAEALAECPSRSCPLQAAVAAFARSQPLVEEAARSRQPGELTVPAAPASVERPRGRRRCWEPAVSQTGAGTSQVLCQSPEIKWLVYALHHRQIIEGGGS